MGQPPEASRLAEDWYCVFVVALPFVVVFNVTWTFLRAHASRRP